MKEKLRVIRPLKETIRVNEKEIIVETIRRPRNDTGLLLQQSR